MTDVEHDDVLVPDSTQPIVAYRCWKVDTGGAGKVLRSPVREVEWPTEGWIRASCSDEPHTAPGSGCVCGLYATKDLDDLMSTYSVAARGPVGQRVFGRVHLAGRVIEHDLGYRAERGRLVEVLPVWNGQRELAEDVAARYGVAVGEEILTVRTTHPARVRAMNSLGWSLHDVDAAAAERWYRLAIEAGTANGMALSAAGHVGAMVNLGSMLLKREPDEAELLFRKAIEAGDGMAMNNLAVLLREREPEEAERWLRRAIEAGNEYGLTNLGWQLRERDPEEAERLLRRAIDAGHVTAMHCLGILLLDRDPEEADRLCRAAIETNFVGAKAELEVLLEDCDPAVAAGWRRRVDDAFLSPTRG